MEYVLPEIRDYNGDLTKRWAVYWYVNGERQVEWISLKLKTLKDRYLEADRIIKEVTEQLQNHSPKIVVTSKIKLSIIIETALQFKKLYVSFRTYQSYSDITYKLIDWIKANNLNDLPVAEFTKYHANQFIESYFLKGKQYEAKTINTTIGYLHTIFERIKDCYPIPENPFRMDKLIEKEPDSEIWTEDLKKKISRYLKKHNQELFIILLFVYHCYLRPDEIRKIQVKNINLAKGTIKVSSKKGKSNCVKYPTISKQLKSFLAPLIKDLSPDTYIFSKGLKPGKKPISRNMISMKFKAIREKLGIPPEYKLYHFKHTGNSEMVDQGLNVRELQKQNGHSSLAITEKYLKRFNDSSNKKIVALSKNL